MYNNGNYKGGGKPYRPSGGGDRGGGGSYRPSSDRDRGGVNGYKPKWGSNKKPSESKPRRKCFTLVLDSETPQYIIDDLVETDILSDLEAMGLYMRITTPEKGGLDTSAIREKYKNHMLMLPWNKFNELEDPYCVTTDDAKGIYKQNSMSELSDAVLTIAGLKVNLLLGESCENPSLFLLTWTIDGVENVRGLSKETGYLSVLIKLAAKHNIKILNLNNASAWEEVLNVAERSANNH